jgi:hypothetical protein
VNNYKRTEEDYIKVNEELRKCGTIQANKIKEQNTIIRELRQELKRKDSELKDIKLELIMLKRRR